MRNFVKNFQHIVQLHGIKSGIDSNPKNLIHYIVGVFQTAYHSVGNILIGRLTQEVAAK